MEESLFRRAKLEAARQGRPMSAILEDALERYFSEREGRGAQAPEVAESWGAIALPPDVVRRDHGGAMMTTSTLEEVPAGRADLPGRGRVHLPLLLRVGAVSASARALRTRRGLGCDVGHRGAGGDAPTDDGRGRPIEGSCRPRRRGPETARAAGRRAAVCADYRRQVESIPPVGHSGAAARPRAVPARRRRPRRDGPAHERLGHRRDDAGCGGDGDRDGRSGLRAGRGTAGVSSDRSRVGGSGSCLERASCGTFRCSLSGNNSVVECDLAKVEVAGSNPVSRSIFFPRRRAVVCRAFFVRAGRATARADSPRGAVAKW